MGCMVDTDRHSLPGIAASVANCLHVELGDNSEQRNRDLTAHLGNVTYIVAATVKHTSFHDNLRWSVGSMQWAQVCM